MRDESYNTFSTFWLSEFSKSDDSLHWQTYVVIGNCKFITRCLNWYNFQEGSLANILKAVPAQSWCLSDSLAQQRDHVSRALKAGSNTPKYGLIFHSSFLGQAAAKKQRLQLPRYLANKCGTASGTGCFSEVTPGPSVFGEGLQEQVWGVAVLL